MAKSRKPTPETSKIERVRPLAYARRQKSSGGDDAKEADEAATKAEAKPGEAKSEATSAAKADEANVEAKGDARPQDKADATTEAKPEARPEAKTDEPAAAEIEPPPPKGEPWPDATPAPMRPVEPARPRAETVAMPAELVVGAPPELPRDPGSVEDPTWMPGPRDVPSGSPTDPASPPGRVPPGDSRSLRKGNEFALVYRVQTCVISRFGTVGTRGQWRVVDYPTTSSASNAYAKECSRFVSEGFSDYRD